jgi:hypothetical protein
MNTKYMQIVLAWATETGLEKTGRYVTRDRNLFPELKAVWEGKACMWKNRGTMADMQKAIEHCHRKNKMNSDYQMTVYTFETKERDPLGKARTAVVAAITKA